MEEELKEEEISDSAVADDTAQDDLQSRCDEFEHKYKLALADYQNLLKQSAKDRRDSILYANEALILELIPVYDNLKLSLKHSGGEGNASWLIGINHIIQQFKKVLEDAGIKEVVTAAKEFDPLVMEAVEERKTETETEDGLVAEELKGGYMLHEKIIIPARVAVYKY